MGKIHLIDDYPLYCVTGRYEDALYHVSKILRQRPGYRVVSETELSGGATRFLLSKMISNQHPLLDQSSPKLRISHRQRNELEKLVAIEMVCNKKYGRKAAAEYLYIDESSLEDYLKVQPKQELLTELETKSLSEIAHSTDIPQDYLLKLHDIRLMDLQSHFGFARIRPNAQIALEERIGVERGYLANLRRKKLL